MTHDIAIRSRHRRHAQASIPEWYAPMPVALGATTAALRGEHVVFPHRLVQERRGLPALNRAPMWAAAKTYATGLYRG